MYKLAKRFENEQGFACERCGEEFRTEDWHYDRMSRFMTTDCPCCGLRIFKGVVGQLNELSAACASCEEAGKPSGGQPGLDFSTPDRRRHTRPAAYRGIMVDMAQRRARLNIDGKRHTVPFTAIAEAFGTSTKSLESLDVDGIKGHVLTMLKAGCFSMVCTIRPTDRGITLSEPSFRIVSDIYNGVS